MSNTPTNASGSELKVPKLPIGDNRECAETSKKVLKSQSFFDVLQTDEGFLSLQSFLVSHQQLYLDQITFQSILVNILEEYEEFEAIEIFDVLETTGNGVLTIKEFYVFVLLLAAIESEQALLCLYYHGPLIFEVISGGQEFVNEDRVQSILRIAGYDEFEIQDRLDQFKIDSKTPISNELFQTILYSVFKEINKTLVDLNITDEEIK